MRSNAPRLRALRQRLGLTQAELVKRAGVSLRTVKAAEAGAIGAESARRLAAALNVEVIQILKEFAGLSSIKDFPRFLLQQTFPRTDYEVVDVLRQAAVADMRRDFDGAASRLETALEVETADDLDIKAQVIIRWATSLDNAQRSREALHLLEPLLTEPRWRDVRPSIMKWLKYHVALAHRRLAERSDERSGPHLVRAEELFRELEWTGESTQRVAAIHQLGCVSLVRARKARTAREKSRFLRLARHRFEDAARRWRKSENFREGYSLRRLGDLAELEGDWGRAHGHLLDALEVFVRHDCYRYRDEVRAHLGRVLTAVVSPRARP